MIKLFSNAKMFWFPKSWANAVSRWIMGVHSPNGTITIHNTANPGDNGSVALDVNISAIAHAVEERLGADKTAEWTALDHKRVRDEIRSYLDGSSIVWKDGRATVNLEWLTEHISSLAPDAGSDLLKTSDIGVTVAAQDHTHTIEDITDFDDHTHTVEDITDFDDHTHTISDITDFDDHTHTTSDISDFSSHTHTTADITDFDTSSFISIDGNTYQNEFSAPYYSSTQTSDPTWPNSAKASDYNTSWTRGSNGMSMYVLSNITKQGTILYVTFRKLSFDKNGMLQSISAEGGAFRFYGYV